MIVQALPRNPVSAPAKAWTEDAFAAFLANRGTLNSAALERITRLKRETGDRLCSIVVRLGLLSERLLADALAQFTGLSMMGANGFPPAPVLADRLSPRFLRRSGVVPVVAGPDGVIRAVADVRRPGFSGHTSWISHSASPGDNSLRAFACRSNAA